MQPQTNDCIPWWGKVRYDGYGLFGLRALSGNHAHQQPTHPPKGEYR